MKKNVFGLCFVLFALFAFNGCGFLLETAVEATIRTGQNPYEKYESVKTDLDTIQTVTGKLGNPVDVVTLDKEGTKQLLSYVENDRLFVYGFRYSQVKNQMIYKKGNKWQGQDKIAQWKDHTKDPKKMEALVQQVFPELNQ